MTTGRFVDYCIEWNEANEPPEDDRKDGKKVRKNKDKEVNRRAAGQSDWDALLG